MKSIIVFLIFISMVATLPYPDQMTLANSLQVGRQEDVDMWQCSVCGAQNKPIHSHVI